MYLNFFFQTYVLIRVIQVPPFKKILVLKNENSFCFVFRLLFMKSRTEIPPQGKQVSLFLL